MLVRESPDESTLRADVVSTWKSCIDVDHIAKESGKHFVKALKEKIGEFFMFLQK